MCDKPSQPSRGQKRKQTNCWSAKHLDDHDDHDNDGLDDHDDDDDDDNGGGDDNEDDGDGC